MHDGLSETEYCEPPDGLYQPGHSECEKCFRKLRQICQIFAVYRGLKEPSDYVEDFKVELQSGDVGPIEKLRVAKGGW